MYRKFVINCLSYCIDVHMKHDPQIQEVNVARMFTLSVTRARNAMRTMPFQRDLCRRLTERKFGHL